MSADSTKAGKSRLTVVRSTVRTKDPTARFVRLAHLHKVRDCDQVAAVCYRVRNDEIEFLLVRTRGSGRWTFPKGSAEPGLTHAQAAALEAFEEAGVHGRIEEASFVRYICRKRGEPRKSAARSKNKTLAVNAYLCQVLRLGTPKESNRDRTWFSVDDARLRLREGREKAEGTRFARVVDKAVARIQQLRGTTDNRSDFSQPEHYRDHLQKVQFESVAPIPYIRARLEEMRRFSVPTPDTQNRQRLPADFLPLNPTQEIDKSPKWLAAKKIRALGTGTNNP